MTRLYDEKGMIRTDLSDRDLSRKVWKWSILAVVAVLVLSAAGWGLSVALSNTTGAANAIKAKNSATNRTQAQAGFESSFQAIKALNLKLHDAQAAYHAYEAAHPGYTGNGSAFDPVAEQLAGLQQIVTGTQAQCRNAVASYDAAARTYTLQDFRDVNLPKAIDALDPFFQNGLNQITDFDCSTRS